MNNNDESDWFTICDEKNIILEKNSNNAYKITFSIHSTGEETVLNVLKNGQLFELLSALNPDVVDNISVTEHTNNVHDVFITFKNSNKQDGEEVDKIINVYFSLKYEFKENRCIISSQNCQDDNGKNDNGKNDNGKNDNGKNDNGNPNSQIKKKDEKEFLPVSKIKLRAVEKNNKTSLCLIFKVDSKKSSNIINMYIGLYFKKIFYRFKQYFE
jgi:hypothetical protein